MSLKSTILKNITLLRAFKSQRNVFLNPHLKINVYVQELDLVYISIPKTGNSSIRSLLVKRVGEDYNKDNYKTIHNRVDTLFTYIGKKEIWQNKKMYTFSFVRNPFDRLVSCYKNKIIDETYFPIQRGYVDMFYKGMPFDEFVKSVCQIPDFVAEKHFKSQYSYLYYKNELIVDYLGKFENMTEDFKVIKDKFSLDELPHMNKSTEGKDYRNYYSPDLVEMVYERYKNDVIKFNYMDELEDLKQFVQKKRNS